MESNQTKLPPNPCESANLFSKLSFWWTITIFKKCLKISLSPSDLFSANRNDSSKLLGDNLERCWTIKQSKNRKLSLLKTIRSAFKLELFQLGLFHLSVHMIKSLCIPYFLGQFLLYYSKDSGVSFNSAVRSAFGLLFSIGYVVIMGNQFQAFAQHLGMRVRIAVCSLIYRKTLRLSRTALIDTNPGKVINLISNDVTRFENIPFVMNSLWISPLNSLFIIYFLWSEARWGSIVGIIIVMLGAPIQSYFGKLTAKYRHKIAIKTDERVRLMEEIISGCQVIKMYAWEQPFSKLIQKVRKLELNSVRKSTLLWANFLALIFFTYRFAVFSTVTTLVLMKDTITASKIFSILAFYMALSMQITRYFFLAFTGVSEIWVVLKRLQKYMELDEICVVDHHKSEEFQNYLDNKHPYEEFVKLPLLKSHEQLENGVIISINNGITRWSKLNKTNRKNEAFSLKNINIDFKKGMLVGIIGPVGSGKTSLLQTILQELPLVSGSIIIDGNISYASQEPWVFSGSVRQNILFGQLMDQERYDNTVKSCALLEDLRHLPHGDASIVGDKGTALSGGQKARINLARAIYREADIYLLDDPLSAVDAHVGRLLFNNVIGPKSELAKIKSTRILVTHQVHFLSEADWIISLKDGTIEFQGTVSNLSQSGLNTAQLFKPHENKSIETVINATQQSHDNETITEETTSETPLQQNLEQSSKDKLVESLFINFLKCGATPFRIFLFAALFIGAAACASSIDLWLSYLVSKEELRNLLHMKNHTTEINHQEVNLWKSAEYLYVYTALIFGFISILVVRSIVASSTMANLSLGLHEKIFNCVISSPIRFFDINPTGRILNRFSQDLGNVDEIFPKTLIDTVQTALNVPLIYIVVATTMPILAIPMTIMLLMFIYLTRTFLKTSNDIKRVEAITRSPVFSHMVATLSGLSTIRAFTAEKILIQEFDSHQDIHSGAFVMYIYTSTAFGFALEMMSFMSILTVIVIVLHLDSVVLQGNKIGLVITQLLIIQELLYICAKQFSLLCNIMMGVERLLEYKNLPQEKQPSILVQSTNKWPSQGKIEFKSVNYRYVNESAPVLIDLNFLINGSEKIGIVGRTGAGKSSLIGAIFRLASIEGKILIDDIDTGSILLTDLRTKISIIPQDPVLFSGTIRRNLDPFEEFDDNKLWKVLEEVELKDIILSSGLESVVLTGGNNFSVGQKQLICLARALLRNNKILVLDEATANVDPDTDILIQRTIREKFINCTVLTIAHRIHTIIDSTRVLVLSHGKIVEFAAPYQLLQKTEGSFKKMIEATGHDESERLKSLINQQFSVQLDNK